MSNNQNSIKKIMNKNKIELLVNMRENTNQKSDQYGRLYPYIARYATLDTRGVCESAAMKNNIYGRHVIEGVESLLSDNIIELLSTGVAVQITGFGTFYPTLESRPTGVANLDEARALGADNIVAGIHVRFLPDSTELDNITSKKFKERCALKYHMLDEVTVTEVDGKKKYTHVYKPISEVANAPEPEPPTP